MTVKTIYKQKLEDQNSNRQIVSVWTDSSAFLSRHVMEANCRASQQTNVPSFMGFLFFLGAEDKDGKFVSRTLLTSQLTVFSLSSGRCIARVTTWNIVPNIIHKNGLFPYIAQCIQSCVIFILALFVQSFLKFSLEINSFFLYSSGYCAGAR